jgi:general secretion pathway protein D
MAAQYRRAFALCFEDLSFNKKYEIDVMKYILFFICLALGSVSALQAQPKRTSAPVTLNFANAEIEAVARTIATLTNRNVVVDPRVKGLMNLSTERPLSSAEAFNQFLSALRLQGFTVVESGGLYKVVPEADAKLQGGESTVVAPGETSKVAGNQIVTQIFKLNFESANNLVAVLRPLISPNNTINVNAGNNSLIITDYRENLSRLARIIAAMDVSNATDLEIIPVKNGVAADLATLVSKLMESSGGSAPAAGQADTSFKTTIVAEPRSNALIVRAANPARLSLAKSLIHQLDQPAQMGSNGAAGNIYVVHLKNADAAKLAITLRAALQATLSTGQTGSGSGVAGTSAATSSATSLVANAATSPIAASASPSTGGQIQADPATNSLIITAPEPQYRQLRAVIDKLDSRRAQVFVESLIAEVNSDKAAAFGVQWQGAVGNTALGTNFGTTGNLATITSSVASGAAATLSKGFNIGVVQKIGSSNQLGFLANFLETTGDGNVLSTPNLLTLDNEEAKIVVGQNVPFLTGQYTNSSAGSTTNPFQTIERKDVGITLRVKPQISENGTIKMTIFQEVSSVDASSVNSTTGLVTNKRSLESNVLVEDGAIVVLGGLLQDTTASNQQRVPGLADIPFFGALFRSETKSRVKTNLMVFLRPVIVRDGASTEALSLERYQNMRGMQLDTESEDKLNSIRYNYGTPVLPAVTPDTPLQLQSTPQIVPPAILVK